MKVLFTKKAELDRVGVAGESAKPENNDQLTYWLAHGYVTVSQAKLSQPTMTDADIKKPIEHGMVKKTENP